MSKRNLVLLIADILNAAVKIKKYTNEQNYNSF